MAPEPNNTHNKDIEDEIEEDNDIVIIDEGDLEEMSSGEEDQDGQDNIEYEGYKLLQQDDTVTSENAYNTFQEIDHEESEDDVDEENKSNAQQISCENVCGYNDKNIEINYQVWCFANFNIVIGYYIK